MSKKEARDKVDEIRARQVERTLGITPEKKNEMRREALRKNRWNHDDPYWNDPLLLRAYIRVLYAAFGGLIGGIFVERLGMPFVGQWVVFALLAAFILVFRIVYPHGFKDMFSGVYSMLLESNEEIAAGNFDGVPKSVQKFANLPERQQDLEEQKALIREMQARKASRQSMSGHQQRSGKIK